MLNQTKVAVAIHMESKKKLSVELKVKELIFDVMNKTHLTGVSREASGEANFETSAHMQASEDDEHSYQLRRSITNAFAHLKVALGEYLSEDTSTTDNLINKVVDGIDNDFTDTEKKNYFKNAVAGVTATQESDQGAYAIKTSANSSESTDTWGTLVQTYNSCINTIKNEDTKRLMMDTMDIIRGVLRLVFTLPSNFNSAASDSLGKGLHEYIVNKTIFDWFSITNKKDAQDYLTMAESALNATKQALYKRSRPIRPNYEE